MKVKHLEVEVVAEEEEEIIQGGEVLEEVQMEEVEEEETQKGEDLNPEEKEEIESKEDLQEEEEEENKGKEEKVAVWEEDSMTIMVLEGEPMTNMNMRAMRLMLKTSLVKGYPKKE